MAVKRQRMYKRRRTIVPKYKRYVRRSRIVRQPRTPVGFPKVYKHIHRYSGIVTTTGTGTQNWTFRANSLYDPDFTSTGNSAMGYSILTGIYNHYCVIGAVITIKSMPAGNTTEDAFRVTVWTTDSSTLITGPGNIAANPGAVTKMSTAINPSVMYFKQNWSLKKSFPGASVSDSRFIATGATNPTEQMYFNISVTSIDGGVSSISCVHEFDIRYIAIWSERRQLDYVS